MCKICRLANKEFDEVEVKRHHIINRMLALVVLFYLFSISMGG